MTDATATATTTATATPPREAFTAAAEVARRRAGEAGKRANQLSLLRLGLFVILVVLAILAFAELGVGYGIGAIVLGLVAFNALVGRQQAAEAVRDRELRVVEIDEGELASLDYDFSRFGGGARYADYDHAYTGDLDVFGENSVFQLVNRTSSLVGEKALADYARHPLQDVGLIGERQDAVRELAPELGFRQNFAAAAPTAEQTPAHLDALRTWAGAEPQFQESYWRWVLVLVPIVNVAWLASFFYLPFFVALLGYAPTAYLLYRHKARVDAIEAGTAAAVGQLGQLAAMLGAIGKHVWQSDLLRRLADGVRAEDGASVAGRIARLRKDVEQLAVRANPYVIPLNILFLWELRYARKIERWKVGMRAAEGATGFAEAAKFELPTAVGTPTAPATRLDAWLRVVGAFDALASMAGVAFRYPAWRFGEVVDDGGDGPHASATALHHPLLPPARSVANGFASPLRRHISLLTGSNMAGKSTLLRTVGLHLAMTQWGMPTPHAALRFSPVRVYTSMRTQDNLHEGASAFYAELQRLRVVVDATRAGEPVFFLLDEILKGTNSLDRNAGGRALILQLLSYGGAGVVATHDLELGKLADETDAVSTLRLEVETDAQGELYFDYTVKAGLAQSRNASALMRKLGLGKLES